jgi:hypothetical protein
MEAVAQAPPGEVEYRSEGERAEGELKLAAAPMLREIYESDLRPILAAHVELVEVFVALVIPVVRPTRFCLLCLSLSTATETKPPQQSAERKVDYQD